MRELLTLIDEPEEKKGDAKLQGFLLPTCNMEDEHGVGYEERTSAVTHDRR